MSELTKVTEEHRAMFPHGAVQTHVFPAYDMSFVQ